jgi:hypothetical protein
MRKRECFRARIEMVELKSGAAGVVSAGDALAAGLLYQDPLDPPGRSATRGMSHRVSQYRTVAIERSRARPISRSVAPLRASSSSCLRSGAPRGANVDTG